MKFDSMNQDCESTHGFKCWVTSLNRDELLDAMAFTFQPDPITKTSMATPSLPYLNVSNSSIAKSHEYDLLSDMVKDQPPPPTPVHPRAMGFKSRSEKGARLDYFFREEENLRWTKPRLFQWVEQHDQSSHFYNNFGGRATHRDRTRNRNRYATNNSGGTSTSKRRFRVIARQKVAPWGDVYSLGCTKEQYDADYQLIQGVRLGRYRRDGRYHATACFVCSGTRAESEIEYTAGGSNIKSKGHWNNSTNRNSYTSMSILHMLRIASRGQFYEYHPMSSLSKTTTERVSYCASWLQPTERWFSLSMYLASRFQISLWDSYMKVQSNKSRQQQHQLLVNPARIIRQGGDWDSYKESILRDSIIRSVQSGLRDMLKEEKMSSRLNYLRDGTLWSILEGNPRRQLLFPHTTSPSFPRDKQQTEGYWRIIACTWTQVNLVEMHIPFNSKLKRMVNEKLEEELAAQMEQVIFEEDKLEQQKSRNDDTAGTLSTKKKRKKKKRKQSKTSNGSTDKSNTLPTIPIKADDGEDKDEHVSISSNSSPREGKITSKNVPGKEFEFPRNSVAAHERNRNTIFVLGILEDIMEQAFSEVGLMATPKWDEPVKEAAIDVVSAEKDSKADSLFPSTSHHIGFDNKHKGSVDSSIELSSVSETSKKLATNLIHSTQSLDQEFTNHKDENAFSFHTMQNQTNIDNPFAVGNDFTQNSLHGIGGYVDFRFVNHYQSRERSILTNFFESQNEKIDNNDADDDEERLMAASTAASIASSSYKDTTVVAETEELPVPANVITEMTPACAEMSAIRESDDACSKSSDEAGNNLHIIETNESRDRASSVSSSLDFDLDAKPLDEEDDSMEAKTAAGSDHENRSIGNESCYRSPTLRAPSTPPPTLSPILVSLADLKKVKRFHFLEFDNATLPGPGSLPPNSPVPQDSMICSWSREDLRIESFRDDHNIKNQQRDRIKSRRGLEIPTYKSVVAKSLIHPTSSSRQDTVSLNQEIQSVESFRRKQHQHKESCAQSETAIDSDQREHQDWYREEVENQSLAKDETTTIISGISHRVEPEEELAVVQEERNNFRDMCLTLGAEVAKLKVLLAAQQAAAAAPVDFQEPSFGYSKMYSYGSYDPHGMRPFFNGMSYGLRPGPRSDAGFLRYGDHESLFSEDEMYDPISKAREARIDSVQRMASSQTIASQTVAESDVSIDFTSIKIPVPGGQVSGTMSAHSFHFNGLQSRLTKDILQFLEATNMKMKKLDGKRKLAVQRFSRLVKTVWPRAQVKVYGSYISGLCLPTSDLDFVVCLPAVHKRDLALAPGVLEGRNAINETSQKLLARELKGESWIDPRSIKVIERTAVPVIKVSTKDTRARMIHLDISFDGPKHNGLDANRMVAQILEEMPLIRPLMLVLKQFLLHRGLLTAYTGGLSSYCLFLMLARYLQEQPLSNSDCGSLLMGFLDFYGNFFDPRAIGISVGGRRYFARANSNTAAAGYEPTGQPISNRSVPPHQQHQKHVVINDLPPISSSNSVVFRRRNSFSDTGSVDDSRHRHRFFAKPAATNTTVTPGPNHLFVPLNTTTHPKKTNFPSNHNHNNFSGYDRPSTFDPLFVEDPTNATNNVGRNAFRINQVQRAFSDAHRALVASLDWDIQSAEGNGKYPLLKCLLGNQREDVLYGV